MLVRSTLRHVSLRMSKPKTNKHEVRHQYDVTAQSIYVSLVQAWWRATGTRKPLSRSDRRAHHMSTHVALQASRLVLFTNQRSQHCFNDAVGLAC